MKRNKKTIPKNLQEVDFDEDEFKVSVSTYSRFKIYRSRKFQTDLLDKYHDLLNEDYDIELLTNGEPTLVIYL